MIPAGLPITLFVGSRPAGETNTTTHFYWGRSQAVFDNVSASLGLADGGYLFDPQGDLRLWLHYPCRTSCADPLEGKVVVGAEPKAPEAVFVRNVSAEPADLEGYVVENLPYVYYFGPRTILNPGEKLRLVVNGSAAEDTRLVKYWGKNKYILNDSGDKAGLRTASNITISCYAWGSMDC